MEKCGNLSGIRELRVCSACAGDYEDPDRTAGEEFDELLEEHEEIVTVSNVVEQPPIAGPINRNPEECRW